MKRSGTEIVFCWIPSHIGLKGNEQADAAAKEALNIALQSNFVISSDFRPLITQTVCREWQRQWDELERNKLKELLPNIKEYNPPTFKKRREEVIWSRLRIGHTYFTHNHLLKGEPPPFCLPCNETITVEHLLIKCVDLADVRKRFYNVNTMNDLFNNVNFTKLLNFLKTINIYHKI